MESPLKVKLQLEENSIKALKAKIKFNFKNVFENQYQTKDFE